MSKRKSYLCRPFIVLMVFSSTFAAHLFAVQDEDYEKSTGALAIRTFATDPNNLGVISKSINLYTGDINLPLKLISIPGKDSLELEVTVFYNSNVQNQASSWNVDSPTGILGLGWSLNSEKIIVDHKNTDSRYDDDFYLVVNGTSNLLIRTGSANDNPYVYQTREYHFWKINYYPSDERWEIAKENGFTYVFGGGVTTLPNGNLSSSGNSIEWGIKWENWIGSSSETNGQSQFALAWNLAQIKSNWDEYISFTYEQTAQKTSDSGVRTHTEAAYLKEVMDIYGRKVVFTYSPKLYAGQKEYQDPSAQTNEPDAYQDRYETKFLDSLEVFVNNPSKKIFSVDFEYEILGQADLAKRYLKEITQTYSENKSLPSLKFEYYPETHFHHGALQTITLPQGGAALYSYHDHSISHSSRSISINSPGGGFNSPKVWIGGGLHPRHLV